MTKFVDTRGYWIYEGEPILGIQSLARLKIHTPILDLSNVPLSHLPKELASIHGLEELYLHENGSSRLPKNLGEISKLRLLSLGKNQLSTLPESLRNRWDTFEII